MKSKVVIMHYRWRLKRLLPHTPSQSQSTAEKKSDPPPWFSPRRICSHPSQLESQGEYVHTHPSSKNNEKSDFLPSCIEAEAEYGNWSSHHALPMTFNRLSEIERDRDEVVIMHYRWRLSDFSLSLSLPSHIHPSRITKRNWRSAVTPARVLRFMCCAAPRAVLTLHTKRLPSGIYTPTILISLFELIQRR